MCYYPLGLGCRLCEFLACHLWFASCFNVHCSHRQRFFIRVPGLTAAKVRRHTPNSVATAYGHLHATRQGIKSTKPKVPPLLTTKPAVSDDNIEEIFATRERRVWCQVDDVRVGRAYSDATGVLPHRGRTGALYQIVFYHEDSNIIHVEPHRK